MAKLHNELGKRPAKRQKVDSDTNVEDMDVEGLADIGVAMEHMNVDDDAPTVTATLPGTHKWPPCILHTSEMYARKRLAGRSMQDVTILVAVLQTGSSWQPLPLVISYNSWVKAGNNQRQHL